MKPRFVSRLTAQSPFLNGQSGASSRMRALSFTSVMSSQMKTLRAEGAAGPCRYKRWYLRYCALGRPCAYRVRPGILIGSPRIWKNVHLARFLKNEEMNLRLCPRTAFSPKWSESRAWLWK